MVLRADTTWYSHSAGVSRMPMREQKMEALVCQAEDMREGFRSSARKNLSHDNFW